MPRGAPDVVLPGQIHSYRTPPGEIFLGKNIGRGMVGATITTAVFIVAYAYIIYILANAAMLTGPRFTQ